MDPLLDSSLNAHPQIGAKRGLAIVLYNYVQPDELGSAGGGVAVYMRNLSTTLRSQGHRVWTLSSGDQYDICGKKPRLERRSEYEYIIYNSPVVAPAIFSFHHPDIFLKSDLLDSIAKQLAEQLSDIDIIHFHNIEGLTLGFFNTIRHSLPEAAIIYSAHNYNIGCPQVNLWKHDIRACEDYAEGFACIECCTISDGRSRKILINRMKTPVKKLAKTFPRFATRMLSVDLLAKKASERYVTSKTFQPTLPESAASNTGMQANIPTSKAKLYREIRTTGAMLVNSVFDRTIAVSRRTADILLGFGAEPERVNTLYIGTKHADRMDATTRKVAASNNVHIGYLGYMRRDKGFYFFLESIKHLASTDKALIDVTIAAKFTDADAVFDMKNIANEFRSFNMFDGYTHANLSDILAPVNIGIVPPLWEDNLPQVAIEFVSHGIPVLTSNMGGAQEISNNPNFVFDINNPESLSNMLQSILRGKLDIEKFWANEPNIFSNSQHVAKLTEVYRSALERRRQRMPE